MIKSSGTIFYSLLDLNSRLGFVGLQYLYPEISVIIDSLPAKTEMWDIDKFVDGHSAISRISLEWVLQECIINWKDICTSNMYVITLIFACHQFYSLKCTISYQSLFGSETLEGFATKSIPKLANFVFESRKNLRNSVILYYICLTKVLQWCPVHFRRVFA